LSDEVIEAIHERRAPVGLEAGDAGVVKLVLELLRQYRISDAIFEAVGSQVGNAGIIDVMVVAGYYDALAHCLQALEVELPQGTQSTLTY